jgi:hypothetical protein
LLPLAEEWKKWLHVFAPALLYGILPSAAYCQLMNFVTAIRILNGKLSDENIRKGEVERIEEMRRGEEK